MIIKEENSRLVREMNPDGTISFSEEEERYDLLQNVTHHIDDIIQYVKDESERIGGGFRGPGIRAECFKLLADKIHKAR